MMNKKQNEYLELGKINTLLIDRHTPHGVFVLSKIGEDVLLPQAYVTDEMTDGLLIDLFIYTDSQDRPVATTLKPKAMLGEFGVFEVVDITSFGAFVDWGLPKDLLVPNKFQKSPFKIGEKRFLKIIYDKKTDRLIGSEKIGDFFEKRVCNLNSRQEVSVLIIEKTPLGFKCMVEEKYQGLLYHNEIFESINLGDIKTAYIKNIRIDGNIDLTLRQPKDKQTATLSNNILKLLQSNAGMMPYNYKSDAKLIKEVFSMSKKDFKKALTKLQDEKKIKVQENGIYTQD